MKKSWDTEAERIVVKAINRDARRCARKTMEKMAKKKKVTCV